MCGFVWFRVSDDRIEIGIARPAFAKPAAIPKVAQCRFGQTLIVVVIIHNVVSGTG